MSGKFDQALKKNALPRRLGDVQLEYAPTMWVGRADRPARTALANVALVAGIGFGVATLALFFTRADHETLGGLLVGCIAGFVLAAWLEQRDRRQRAFAVDFAEHVLRLDFSTPLGGMPRTVYVSFEHVLRLELDEQGLGSRVLTVDFDISERTYREVLIADVAVSQLTDAARVRRMLRAAVGLERPADDGPGAPSGPPPPIDTFG